MRLMIGDTETTGLGPTRKAIEVALMEVDADLNLVGTAHAMVNPGCAIDPGATEIHGITDDMVASCPTLEEWRDQTFGGPIEGEVYLVGYRVAFDEPLLRPLFANLVSSWDVLPLVQRTYPELANHKLQTIREHLQLPGGDAHRAMGDVMTTHQLLQVLLPLSGRTLAQHAKTPFEFQHTMPWGKWKGTPLANLPAGYRRWLLEECDLHPHLRRSLELVGATDYVFKTKGTSR